MSRIASLDVAAYRVPTDAPESDGTLEWDATTMVLVSVAAGGQTGIGYTYADVSAGRLIASVLKPLVAGRDAMEIPAIWHAMVHGIRNLGRPGVASMAVAAVDVALWDLKARLLGLSVADLLGRARQSLAAYGSGGFTSYDDAQLENQLGGWAAEGFGMVKMKVGRDPDADIGRMRRARQAIGPDVQLFADLNGALSRKRALAFAEQAAMQRVAWLEEPVSSNDLAGLRLMRDRGPVGMDITAGEYGFDARYFRDMLAAGAVDVLQADATRCAGITGFMFASALCDAFETPLSAHCAPAIHLHPCLAARKAVHLEWFHDHVRIENMLFEGAPVPSGGRIGTNGAAGLGLTFKQADAEPYRVAI
ncbi:enolase C-terminal domain-like protein [Palleronia rufa]|uniref:enolase C-terminal domain-like protein n=1 Tax=Palleronia rufa TaxID=1530186 RepID=UPI0005642856|nr:enolase C-terminal domain-like protein [Palleronia rufa]